MTARCQPRRQKLLQRRRQLVVMMSRLGRRPSCCPSVTTLGGGGTKWSRPFPPRLQVLCHIDVRQRRQRIRRRDIQTLRLRVAEKLRPGALRAPLNALAKCNTEVEWSGE